MTRRLDKNKGLSNSRVLNFVPLKRLTKKPGVLSAKQENPAAFVHRRMAELAAKKKQGI